MDFSGYIDGAWRDHATETLRVAGEFGQGASLVETPAELRRLAGIITHVMGEHLARWDEGVGVLRGLESHGTWAAGSDTAQSIDRSIAALQIGSGAAPDLAAFGPSDRIRVLAVAASALTGHDSARSQRLLREALELAETQLGRDDPANRDLAITGNNLACALEEKPGRTPAETELMILAARTGRTYWERAGTWAEVSMAEYRLAMTYIKAARLDLALEHAQRCVEICRENDAPALDLFYAYESLALVERARANQLGFEKAVLLAKEFFAKMTPETQSQTESSLKALA